MSWSASAGATSYILQEARDGGFSTASNVYVGPATSVPMSGKSPTRYYYRVKARNAAGDSGWSNVQQVDVLWELEPNDIKNQANGSLLSGLTYCGKLSSGTTIGDTDDFYFDAPSAGTAQLTLTLPPALVGHTAIWVYSQSDLFSHLCGTGPVNGSSYSASCPLATAGRYYINLYAAGNQFYDDVNPYSVRVTYP